MLSTWFVLAAAALCFAAQAASPQDGARLYNDLFSERFFFRNLVKPSPMNSPNSSRVVVNIGMSLAQIIGLDMQKSRLTSLVFIKLRWRDHRLRWLPSDYGGISALSVSAGDIWRPDVVLYNNADGHYDFATDSGDSNDFRYVHSVNYIAQALVHADGTVIWEPPAIFRSYCAIDCQYFPYDLQCCDLKIGSWSYNGFMLDLIHERLNPADYQSPLDLWTVSKGINLKSYYPSVQWELVDVPCNKNAIEYIYNFAPEPYIDVTFRLCLKRKTLFYTINLIAPCATISFLCVLIFYLPPGSKEKITLSVNIMLSLTVFYLLLIELVPPTSHGVPLFGKYLIFTMSLVSLSILATVVMSNYARTNHAIPKWAELVFIDVLSKLLFVDPRTLKETRDRMLSTPRVDLLGGIGLSSFIAIADLGVKFDRSSSDFEKILWRRTMKDIRFIAENIQHVDRKKEINSDWKIIVQVIDRILLMFYAIVSTLGIFTIFISAPHDERPNLDAGAVDFFH